MSVAFVTGGTGFIGRHVVEQLRAGDWEVHALHRPGSDTGALERAGARLVEGDLLAPHLPIPEACDAVFHIAADTSIWRPHAARILRTNVEGTANLARLAEASHARRFVFVSSVGAWGAIDGVISEATPKRGASSPVPYKQSKHLAEQALAAHVERGLDAVIVNPCHVIGPYDRGTWARLIAMVHHGTLPGVPDGVGVFCDVRAVAEGIRAAAVHGIAGENHLLGGDRASFLDFVQICGELLDRKVPSRPTPTPLIRAVALAKDAWSRVTRQEPDVTPDGLSHVLMDLRVDDSKARNVLGYRHTPLRELLVDTIAWMRAEGQLG